ncbi:Transitional endoplasmic reticulum ATPase [Folsomia candida]|uniref:Transitional endoplasmic reticulum ATPase n=1 Tax=Folsomia candida TaxID=158441 RepID=A0A226CX73_FOLCA|nr:Transitional endoplasmic reticulum ATPase [Folsomia candida]
MFSKFIKNILHPQKQPPPRRDDHDHIIPPLTFSTIQEQGEGGHTSQLAYLQANLITPFLNRAVYENTGQAEEKVPQGVILYGTNKDGMATITRAVVTELSLQGGGNYVHFVHGDKIAANISECFSPYEKEKMVMEMAFTEAKKFKTAVIFLPDLDHFYSTFQVHNSIEKFNITQTICLIALLLVTLILVSIGVVQVRRMPTPKDAPTRTLRTTDATRPHYLPPTTDATPPMQPASDSPIYHLHASRSTTPTHTYTPLSLHPIIYKTSWSHKQYM